MTLDYRPDLIDAISASLRLRQPNREALESIASALVDADPDRHLVADLATGVGKTYIAAGLIDYLAGAGVRNIVIITPGTTIQRKTIANFTYGTTKFVAGLASNPAVLTVDSFANGSAAAAIDNPDRVKLFVLTVQSLLRPNSTDARRAHRPHESTGVALADYLREADDLVVIADEHHVYSGNAKAFARAIKDLDPLAVVGLTATPDPSTPNDHIVHHYPLSAAIADGFVKVPVLVARPDGLRELRTQLADGLSLLDAKTEAINSYAARTGRTPVNPVMFVVCGSINEANSVRDILTGPDYLNDPDKVLLIHSDEPDTALEALDGIEDPKSPVRVVVSVSMLREGWDVKSIYVICSTRAMDSELLTEQVLGRGLRLPFGARTGISMLDTVEVLSHRRFAELLADADQLLSQTLGERVSDAETITTSEPGDIPSDPAPVGQLVSNADDLADDGENTLVAVQLDGQGAPGQDTLLDDEPQERRTVSGFATISARLAEATATQAALSTTVMPNTGLGVRLPLYIPTVTHRIEREPFSLASIDTTDTEALGARFADDNAPTLIRVALEVERDEAGTRVVATDHSSEARVAATQERLPFENIEGDLAARLLRTNGITQSITEHNASIAVARAFLRGAGVTEDTPWRAAHGRLATEALVRFIDQQQLAAPVRQVADVTQTRWPEPPEHINGVPPTNRNHVTRPGQFIRNHPYTGWRRSLYPVMRFDSYGAEFRLAVLLDNDDSVTAWTRITPELPLRIAYTTGSVARHYIPDFLAIDDAGVHWVLEAKADSEMTDAIVVAKADAASQWVRTVNASPAVGPHWAYALVSETAIRSAAGWRQLLAAARITR
ncbi:DEAD/DEAH box helicase [Janibacter sp. G368]|uniref:DEAD/DEAH box helicase n=1 Tax=Janibacter sp. G368 TaxID=3420441 RepID=UPI003CFFA5F6